MIFKLKKLAKILVNQNFTIALMKGAAAAVEHRAVLSNLKSCHHIVDIGANRGQFALIFRDCYPDARIDSFEPLNEPVEIYQRVFSGDNLAQIHPYAIGAEKGTATIHVSNRDDSSSLLPISDRQTALFPETAEKETRAVRVVPLEEALQPMDIKSPALLKLDVQGFELTALQGCLSLLNEFRYVYVECSFIELYAGQSLASEVIEFLDIHSFAVSGVYNVYYDKTGKAIQADFMFERSE